MSSGFIQISCSPWNAFNRAISHEGCEQETIVGELSDGLIIMTFIHIGNWAHGWTAMLLSNIAINPVGLQPAGTNGTIQARQSFDITLIPVRSELELKAHSTLGLVY